jgi:hypothetical protein
MSKQVQDFATIAMAIKSGGVFVEAQHLQMRSQQSEYQ